MYDMGMAKLCRVKFADVDGKDFSIRAIDIVSARELDATTVELFIEGVGSRTFTTTVTAVDAAVDAFWDAWLAELPA